MVRGGTSHKPGRTLERGEAGRRVGDRLVEYLLRRAVGVNREIGIKGLGEKLQTSYSTLTANLRRLAKSGTVVPTYQVNPFKTRFCHEFRVGVRITAHRVGGHSTLEKFVEKVIRKVHRHPEFGKHIIITDAVMLHGAGDRDMEFTVLTDDGAYSIGKYIRAELINEAWVAQVTTVTVGWRRCFDGYSGEHANRWNRDGKFLV
ncbi:MAG: hypothetical protein V3W34_08855 [Phycisphaerae bacterium]